MLLKNSQYLPLHCSWLHIKSNQRAKAPSTYESLRRTSGQPESLSTTSTGETERRKVIVVIVVVAVAAQLINYRANCTTTTTIVTATAALPKTTSSERTTSLVHFRSIYFIQPLDGDVMPWIGSPLQFLIIPCALFLHS